MSDYRKTSRLAHLIEEGEEILIANLPWRVAKKTNHRLSTELQVKSVNDPLASPVLFSVAKHMVFKVRTRVTV